MKKSVVFALVCVLLMGLLAVTATAESYDIIYLTPSTASTFWSQVEVGILQAKADLEKELGITVNYTIVGPAEEQETEEVHHGLRKRHRAEPQRDRDRDPVYRLHRAEGARSLRNGHRAELRQRGLGSGNDGAYEQYYNEFYYCSNDTIGELAGQAFLAAMEKKGVPTDNGIIGVNMNVENEALNHRIQAFRDYIAANAPALKMTETYYNNNVVENSQTNAENIISSYGKELIGMYSGNNITADGVCNAVRSAGLGEKFVSVGVDSDDIEIKALRDGFSTPSSCRTLTSRATSAWKTRSARS